MFGRLGVGRQFFAVGAVCLLALGLFSAPGPARANDSDADTFFELRRCLAISDTDCLAELGRDLSGKISDPRQRSLMLGRFALVDWASGDKLAGNTRFLRAWNEAMAVQSEGCFDRIETLFELEELASGVGHRSAARFLMRGLLLEARDWSPEPGRRCVRPQDEISWLERLARRQNVLGDASGVTAALDLAYHWSIAAPEERPPVAPAPSQGASLLASFGRDADAIKICDSQKTRALQALPADGDRDREADIRWETLACYRAAGLRNEAQLSYQEFSAAKAAAIGLAADPAESSAGAVDTLDEVLWEMVQDLSWDDPVLFDYTPDFPAKSSVECFERPTARCLTTQAMEYVNTRNRKNRRRAAQNWSAGSLDGLARFLVGSGQDPFGSEAQGWFMRQTDEAPVEDLSMLVGNAVRTGDLIWARSIFYSWYTRSGTQFFNDLDPPEPKKGRNAKSAEEIAETWPLHVAWKIASVIADLDPAFEPEELAEFGEEAWVRGVSLLPPLRELPRVELIDVDERSGTHLLNLCSRNAFGMWAAELFTKAHVPQRAAEAEAMLPEAARDCAFARRSVGPIIAAAEWFAEQGDTEAAQTLLAEAADRLTRPHYHVYPDTDPTVGGAALAATALGLSRGIAVPAPYTDGF